jgi:uncharacterized membrane protein SpoIIM required for sporulation
VTLERFLAERRQSWDELAELVVAAGRRPERLGPERVRRLAGLYREAAADLAVARRRWPGDPVVRRLESLVGRARHLVYDAPTRRPALWTFVRRGYWRLVAERPAPLVVAAVLLFGPGALAGAWALDDPGAAGGLVPAEYRSVTEPRPRGADLDLSLAERADFSGTVLTNNIRVSFLAFAGGIAAGLGTAFVLVLNGVLLGTVGGLATGAGNGPVFLELVVAHGVLELSCIVVVAAAGLRFGWAMVEPRRRTRVESLVLEGRRAVAIALGTAPWFVVAGLVEGFVTPAGLGAAAVMTIGVALGALYWALVVLLGRRSDAALTAARAPSP